MTIWFHAAIVATSLAAGVAVGLTSPLHAIDFAPRGDRLASVAPKTGDFVTIEARSDGVSVLASVPQFDKVPASGKVL